MERDTRRAAGSSQRAVDAGADPAPIVSDPDRSTGWTVATLIAAATLFVLALTTAFGAAESPGNCGELPGIARSVTLLGTLAAAGLLALSGVVAGLVFKSPSATGAILVCAMAVAVGASIGAAVGRDPCAAAAAQVPMPTHQTADLHVTLREPDSGTSITGRATCQRQARGAPVDRIVSAVNHLPSASAWRFGSTFVDLEIWPVTVSGYRPAEHLRVVLDRPADGADAGASAYYSDGRGVVVARTASPDGTSGTITFEKLPLWKPDSRFGSGLPDAVTGELSWSCSGPET